MSDTGTRANEVDEDEEIDMSVAHALEAPEKVGALSLAQYSQQLEEAGTPQVLTQIMCLQPMSFA